MIRKRIIVIPLINYLYSPQESHRNPKIHVAFLFTQVARKILEKRRSQARLSKLLFYSDFASTAIARKACFS